MTMLIHAVFACFVGIVLCQPPKINIVQEHLPNGDEGEVISIDLKKRDGTQDIKLVAHLSFHLNQSHVNVNGHPIVHNRVNSVRMRIRVSEVKTGKRSTPKLAPVTFRILVLEQNNALGQKMLIVQFEFIKVRHFEVLQVDVKQIIWEGSNRKPLTSISIQESIIRRKPHAEDHHIFVPDPGFKPRLPSHGLQGNIDGYEKQQHHKRHQGHHMRHHHRNSHPRIICWFRRLNIAGKIALVCSAVFLFFGAVVSITICWKRHLCKNKAILEVPFDNYVEVDDTVNKDDKKTGNDVKDDDEFHMEINSCAVDVDDKKSLVN